MRLTLFEVLMLLALLALGLGVVAPRITAALPEVRASRARALAVELDALTARWLNAGGLAGPGEIDRTALTQNLLACFSSPQGQRYTSPAGTHPFNYVGEPTAAPADFRLRGLAQAQLKIAALPSGLRAVFVEDQFAALYDGTHWQVWPAP